MRKIPFVVFYKEVYLATNVSTEQAVSTDNYYYYYYYYYYYSINT